MHLLYHVRVSMGHGVVPSFLVVVLNILGVVQVSSFVDGVNFVLCLCRTAC
jgi:hypothetical protein